MICPLCGSAIIFVGLVSLECDGSTPRVERCPNYKALTVQLPVFDDVMIDWEWLVTFCGWLSQISSLPVVPTPCHRVFEVVVNSNDSLCFMTGLDVTRNRLMRGLLRDRAWGPFFVPMIARGELKLLPPGQTASIVRRP